MSWDSRHKVAKRVRFVHRRLWPFGRPHRQWLLIGSGGALMVVMARLAFPWPLRGIIEMAFPHEGATSGLSALVPPWGDPILWLAGAFVLLALTQGLAEYVQRVSFARFAVYTVHDARAAKLKPLLKHAPRPEPNATGDVIARVIGDSARLKAGLKGVLVHVTQNGPFLVGVGVMLAITDLRLGIVFTAGGMAALGLAFGGARRLSFVARRYRKKEGLLADAVHEALTSDDRQTRKEKKQLLERKALGLRSANRKSGRNDVRITRLQAKTTWAMHGVLAISCCLVLTMGVRGVTSGSLLPGDLFVIVAYLLLAHNPTVRLGRQTTRLGKVLASAERLAAVGRLARAKKTKHPPRGPLSKQVPERPAVPSVVTGKSAVP